LRECGLCHAESGPWPKNIAYHLHVAAQEHGVEIQSRMFAPLFGVPEDPATGGANVA
jgi:predicted PhzF superfamily epimerase YddE/YHI9